jgi:hypothetical protein
MKYVNFFAIKFFLKKFFIFILILILIKESRKELLNLYFLKNPNMKKRIHDYDNDNKNFIFKCNSNSNLQFDDLKKNQKIKDEEIFKKTKTENLIINKIEKVIFSFSFSFY